jgi:hypothetical protein
MFSPDGINEVDLGGRAFQIAAYRFLLLHDFSCERQPMSIVMRSVQHSRLTIHHGREAFWIAGTVDLNFREGLRDPLKIL